MIRLWLFEEAPGELRTWPGLAEALADRVPVWLAHQEDGWGEEATLFHDFTTAWLARSGNRICTQTTGGSGRLMVGCRINATETGG